MARRFQLRQFEQTGTRIRGHFTNLDWISVHHPDAALHAAFDIDVREFAPGFLWFDAPHARAQVEALVDWLKARPGTGVLSDAFIALPVGAGTLPGDSIPDLVALARLLLPELPPFTSGMLRIP